MDYSGVQTFGRFFTIVHAIFWSFYGLFPSKNAAAPFRTRWSGRGWDSGPPRPCHHWFCQTGTPSGPPAGLSRLCSPCCTTETRPQSSRAGYSSAGPASVWSREGGVTSLSWCLPTYHHRPPPTLTFSFSSLYLAFLQLIKWEINKIIPSLSLSLSLIYSAWRHWSYSPG